MLRTAFLKILCLFFLVGLTVECSNRLATGSKGKALGGKPGKGRKSRDRKRSRTGAKPKNTGDKGGAGGSASKFVVDTEKEEKTGPAVPPLKLPAGAGVGVGSSSERGSRGRDRAPILGEIPEQFDDCDQALSLVGHHKEYSDKEAAEISSFLSRNKEWYKRLCQSIERSGSLKEKSCRHLDDLRVYKVFLEYFKYISNYAHSQTISQVNISYDLKYYPQDLESKMMGKEC